MAMSALVQESLIRRALYRDQHACGACGEQLEPTQPLYLVELVRPFIQETLLTPPTVTLVPLLTEDGTYLYFPYFFHEKCWEETLDSLREMYEDNPPQLIEGVRPVAECLGCSSHILSGEVTLILYYGLFGLSDRAPSGEWALEYVTKAPPQYICTVCVNDVNTQILPGLWGEDEYITNMGECPEGIATRCWRSGCNPVQRICQNDYGG